MLLLYSLPSTRLWVLLSLLVIGGCGTIDHNSQTIDITDPPTETATAAIAVDATAADNGKQSTQKPEPPATVQPIVTDAVASLPMGVDEAEPVGDLW
ncbi:MAG: hypothetical protein AAFZ92_10405, partial [Pseudomonadota bacterium]